MKKLFLSVAAAPFIEATKVCGDAGPWSAIKRSGSV